MAELIVRNLADTIVQKLEQRAKNHGRTVEAEHREILHEVLEDSVPSFKELLLSMPDVGDDADFERSDDDGRDIEL